MEYSLLFIIISPRLANIPKCINVHVSILKQPSPQMNSKTCKHLCHGSKMAMLAFDRPHSKGLETYPDYIFKVFTYHLTLALQLILSKKAQVILASPSVLYTTLNLGATTLATKWQICSPCEPFHTPFQYNQYLCVTLDSVKDLNEICQVFGATDLNIMM